jgi:uncharacterized protein (DUF1800 family)
MNRSRPRRLLPLAPCLLIALMGFPAWRADGASAPIPRASLGEDERILHALNRLGFGPRPGDLERVRGMGLATYVEQQLHPEMIDDSRVELLLEDSRTLYMTPAELLTEYPPPALLRGISSQLTTRMGMDPDAVGELFPEIRRKDKDQEKGKGKKHRTGKKVPLRKDAAADGRRERMMNGPDHLVVELGHAKLTRAVHGEQQLQEVMTDFWFNHFNVFIGKGATRWWTTGYEYEAIRPHALGKFRDLLGAVARHPAMLFYLDNWLSTAEGTRYNQRTLSPYVSKAIKKQDLPPGGVATLVLRDRGVKTRKIERQIARRERQQRKAMQDQSKARKKNKRGKPKKEQPGGLNENYARELLELHTLGVDGGYTQQDIIEVARCFTGWTVLPVQAAQQFVFVEEFHDNDKKVVLGQRVKGKGVRQGEAVLDRLARHPATARFLSTKLARRFVSDEPPAELVDAMATTFLASDGDIREVMRTMLGSEQFWSPEVVRAKVKTPFEFVVSAARATNAEIDRRRAPALLRILRDLGQPLYGAQPPTGYKDTAEAWLSTGTLLGRMKIALDIAGNRIPGLHVELPETAGDTTEQLLAELGRRLMGTPPPTKTVEVIRQQLELPPEELAQLGLPPDFRRSRQIHAQFATGWLLATPEFQRR